MTPSSCQGSVEQAGYQVCQEMLILRPVRTPGQGGFDAGQVHHALHVVQHRLGRRLQHRHRAFSWKVGHALGLRAEFYPNPVPASGTVLQCRTDVLLARSLPPFLESGSQDPQAAFRRQVRREIYLPIALAILGIILLVVTVIAVAYGTRSSWADVSLVLLAVPFAIVLVLMTAALAGAILPRADPDPRSATVTSGLQYGADRLAGAVRRGERHRRPAGDRAGRGRGRGDGSGPLPSGPFSAQE